MALSWQQRFNTGVISTVMPAVTKTYFFSVKYTFECLSQVLAVICLLRHANVTSLTCVPVIGAKSTPRTKGCLEF